MRILCLHSSSDLYGASKIFLQTVALYTKEGHECVVLLSSEGPLYTALKEKGIEVHICSLGIIRRKYFTPWGLLNRFLKWQSAKSYILKLHQEKPFSIIYSNTLAVWVGAFLKQKLKEQVQHIWHVHEIIAKPVFLFKKLQKLLIASADQVIVVSNAVANHWQHPALNEKMQVIYNGVPPIQNTEASHTKTYHQALGIPADSIIVGMAGRIHFWKGQSWFIDMAHAFLNRIEDHEYKDKVYFIITGDAFKGYENLVIELQNKIEKLGLSKRVFLTGYEPNVDRFYKSIDVFVLPSQLPDPFPTVILEAMQYAKPIIATAQGGALEMLDAKSGYLVPIDNYMEAARRLIPLLVPVIRKLTGEAALQRVNTLFSEEAYEKNIRWILEKCAMHNKTENLINQ